MSRVQTVPLGSAGTLTGSISDDNAALLLTQCLGGGGPSGSPVGPMFPRRSSSNWRLSSLNWTLRTVVPAQDGVAVLEVADEDALVVDQGAVAAFQIDQAAERRVDLDQEMGA